MGRGIEMNRCMRRGLRPLIAASAVAVLGLPLTAAPAVAETPTCVSRAEYRAVKNGWTRARVARVFDVSGRSVEARAPFRARTYNDCWRSNEVWGKVSVVYRYRNGAWRVVDKTKDFWHV